MDINRLESQKPEQDIELEELNKYRRLPFRVEESDKFFFYPFRDVNLSFLEEIYQKHLANLDTHERSEPSDQDLDEYNESENNDSLETYNEEEEELKLSKKTSEMMTEDVPSLRKNRSNMSQKKKKVNLIHSETKAPKSVKSISSKKSKLSNQKLSEEFDDLEELPQLKLK